MRDLSIDLTNIRRTYDIAMGNILKKANKEFHRVLDGKGVHILEKPFKLNRSPHVITQIWTTPGEDVWVQNMSGEETTLNNLHQDDQADLYVSLIHTLR